MQPATIRSWRRRVAEEPPPEVVAITPTTLRQKADEARAMSLRALEQTDRLLSRGLASEGRNAATTSAILAERATELEQAAREEESHETRLAEQDGQYIAQLLRTFHQLVGMPDAWNGGGAADRLFGHMLRELAECRQNERCELKPPAELVTSARRELIERFREEMRDELMAGLLERGAQRALLPPGVLVDRAIEEMAPAVRRVFVRITGGDDDG